MSSGCNIDLLLFCTVFTRTVKEQGSHPISRTRLLSSETQALIQTEGCCLFPPGAGFLSHTTFFLSFKNYSCKVWAKTFTFVKKLSVFLSLLLVYCKHYLIDLLTALKKVFLLAFSVCYQRQTSRPVVNPTSWASFCLSGLICCTELPYNCSCSQAIVLRVAETCKFSRLI